MLNTINRTWRVLSLFTPESPTWGVSEIAAALEIPKSTTFDVLASLAEIGFLQRTFDDRYRLGWRLLVISRRLLGSTCFSDQTQQIITDLAGQLGAVVTVGAWDGHGVVCVATSNAKPTGPILVEGPHLSGHASALGKLLMAHLEQDDPGNWAARNGLTRCTHATVQDIGVLRAQMLSVRMNDFAVEHGETLDGVSCVAVGLYQRERHLVGAVSIALASDRMRSRERHFVHIARRAARVICP